MTFTSAKMKALLKESTAQVYFDSATLTGEPMLRVNVKLSRIRSSDEGNYEEIILWSSGQATLQDKIEHHVPSKYLLGRCKFVYAMKSDAEIRMNGMSYAQYKDPDFLSKFYQVIREKINHHNIQYKYPDCELSQLVEALEMLGVHVKDPKWDGGDYWDWKATKGKDFYPANNNQLQVQ